MIAKTLVRAGLALAPVAVMGAAQAQAPTKPPTSYVSLSVGYFGTTEYDYRVLNFPVHTEVEAGYGAEGAWGVILPSGLRTEVAFSWQDHNDARGTGGDGDGVSAFTLDLNAYLDLAPSQPVNFYIGGGIGVASLTVDDAFIDQSTGDGLHLQGIAGVDFKVGDGLKLFGEARIGNIATTAEDTAGNSSDINIGETSFRGGLRFLF